ncbi:MAG: cell division ATP-binding protein FtsE, partial [Mycoplasmatales bacterium]
ITNLRNKDLPRLRRKICVIFQDYKLLSDKTIFQNVAFSLYVTGYPKNMIKKRVLEVLNKVGIEDQAQKYPDELSGGQQQRAAIARAIVDEPVILVADEPTGNLDPENALAIMELLVKINEEGTTVVMATHDVGIVNNFLNRVVLLGEGKVIKEAKGEYIYE